jgi:hypothetical protein
VAGIGDRMDRLERWLRPPDRKVELISEQGIRDCDELARIVRDSGPQLDNTLARVQELHPELDHYAAQLEAKRIIIEASGPDGPRLWRLLASAVDADYKPPQVREDR